MKIIILLFCFSTIVHSQSIQDSAISNESKKEIDNVGKETSKDTINQNKIYQLLYQETKQTNDRLVSTVHWALGIVATLAILLIGYNVLYNFKISKDQLANLTKEFDNKLDKVRNEDLESLNVKIDNINKDFEQKIDTIKQNLMSDLDSRTKSLSETYEKQTKAYRESTELQVKTLEKSIEEKVNNVNDSINIKYEEFNNKIANLIQQVDTTEKKIRQDFEHKIDLNQWSHYHTEAWLWETKGVVTNQLTAYMNALEIEIKLDWFHDTTLKKISELLDKDGYFRKKGTQQLIILLEKMKGNDVLKEEIKQKLGKVKTFM